MSVDNWNRSNSPAYASWVKYVYNIFQNDVLKPYYDSNYDFCAQENKTTYSVINKRKTKIIWKFL